VHILVQLDEFIIPLIQGNIQILKISWHTIFHVLVV
jgi:hypothetical protein